MDGKEYDPRTFSSAFGCSWEVWSQTVHHAQGERLFLDLSPSERAQVLSDLLNLSLWERLHQDAKELARETDKEVRMLETRTSLLQGQLGAHRRNIQGLEEQIAARNRAREEERARRARQEQELTIKVTEVESQLNSQDSHLRGLELRIKRGESRVMFLLEEVGQCRQDVDALRTQKERMVAEHSATLSAARLVVGAKEAQVRQAQIELERHQHRKHHFLTLGPVCSNCDQPVSEEHKQRHLQELQEQLTQATSLYQQSQEELSRSRQELSALEQRCQQEIQGSKEILAAAVAAVEVKARQHRTAEQEVRAVRRQRDQMLGDRGRTAQELSRLQSDLSRVRDAPLEQQINEGRLDSLLREAQEGRELTERQLQDRRAQCDAVSQKRDDYDFWGKHYLRLRLRLMDQALAELTLLSAPYLEQLGLAGWTFQFTTQQATASGSTQQKLEIEIRRPGEETSIPLAGCSGGERTRLRLAAQMALAAATVEAQQFGFEVWDEPSAYLSGSGLEDLLEVLSQRAQQEQKAIFLVDHTVPEFAFDGVLTLVKDSQGVAASWT